MVLDYVSECRIHVKFTFRCRIILSFDIHPSRYQQRGEAGQNRRAAAQAPNVPGLNKYVRYTLEKSTLSRQSRSFGIPSFHLRIREKRSELKPTPTEKAAGVEFFLVISCHFAFFIRSTFLFKPSSFSRRICCWQCGDPTRWCYGNSKSSSVCGCQITGTCRTRKAGEVPRS